MMAWARIDDQFYLNPKNAPIDRDEQDLLLASYVYCNGQLTDGFIHEGKLSQLMIWAKIPIEANALAIARHLVEHGYWEDAPGGYMIHDYLDWNMSKTEILSIREARSTAGRRGGLAKQANKLAIAKQVLKQMPSKTVPHTHTLNPLPDLKDSHTQERQFSENLQADQLILSLTGWMAIPPSDENLEFMRDVPTIIQRKKEDTQIYLQGFWNTYNQRYPGSTRLAWIGWALTGQIPPNRPESQNGRNGRKPERDIQPAESY